MCFLSSPSILLASLKTMVMFVGEMDYTDLQFTHWVGQLIFAFFIFLMIIVLMNILNGLAVSDISKIREEVDTYHLISTVETLAYTSFVSLLAEEIIIYPNIKPENQQFFGFAIPGSRVYRVKGGKIGEEDAKKKDFFFQEATVKAAKELVYMQQQKSQSLGKVTLDTVRDNLMEVRREQASVKQKLSVLEESIRDLIEIMASRHAGVERI